MANSIFVSYSHRDEVWMQRLTTHLLAMPKAAAIDVWVDTLIGVGELWRQQISDALDRSRAAVLLLSADFLASSFIRNDEVPPLLEAEAARGLAIVPLLTRPCAFEQHPWLAQRQVRPYGAVPLSTKSDSEVDQALTDVSREISALGQERLPASLCNAQVQELAAGPQALALKTFGTQRPAGDYFFYLAKERINNLFAQLPLDFLRRSALNSIGPRASDLAEGETNMTSIAVSRLSPVLDQLEESSRIGDLARVIAQELQFAFEWCMIDAVFEVRGWDKESPNVILDAHVGAYTVTLSCTKSNVIGLVREAGDWIPTSASYFLFEPGRNLPLKGLIRIVMADRNKRQVMASPLYLTLGSLIT
jgi:hypothetical protein